MTHMKMLRFLEDWQNLLYKICVYFYWLIIRNIFFWLGCATMGIPGVDAKNTPSNFLGLTYIGTIMQLSNK